MITGLLLSTDIADGVERWKVDTTRAIRLHSESLRKEETMPTILDPCDGIGPPEKGFVVNEVACEDGFTLARARYRCEVCGKTKPQFQVNFRGIRTIDVCEKCKDAKAAPLWYAVAEVVAVDGVENMTEEGIEMVMTAMAYHRVTTEEFNEMVKDDIAVLEYADAKNKKAGIA